MPLLSQGTTLGVFSAGLPASFCLREKASGVGESILALTTEGPEGPPHSPSKGRPEEAKKHFQLLTLESQRQAGV